MNRVAATMDDVTALIKTGTGKALMDQLRAKLTEFINEEKGLIKARTEEA